MTTDKLYRYEINYTNYDDGDTSLVLREYRVLKETERTYLITDGYRKPRRVKKFAENTYAHAQKEKALEHLLRRTKNRLRWYHYWVKECENAIELAEQMIAKQ